MKTKLTVRAVENADAGKKEYAIFDGEVKGFGLRVRPSGAKTFFFQYRRNGVLGRYTIGAFPTITLSQARDHARKLRSQVVLGGDPVSERSEKRAIPTVNELLDLYLRNGVAMKKSSTLAVDKGRIERHIRPLLGRRRIDSILRHDIEKFRDDVAAGKTSTIVKTKKLRGVARVTGGRGTSARTLGLLGAIFSFAVSRGSLKINPVTGVKKFPDRRRTRFLCEKELARFGEALSSFEGPGPDILRLLLFTGCRRGEIISLDWSEVDFANKCLRLRDTKTGGRIVTLGAPALELLVAHQEGKIAVGPVFPGTNPGRPYGGLVRVWRNVRKLAELDDVRIHDLRHSFASAAVSGGTSLLVTSALLGHRTPSMTAWYSHLSDDPVQRAADATSRRLAGALRAGGAKAAKDLDVA